MADHTCPHHTATCRAIITSNSRRARTNALHHHTAKRGARNGGTITRNSSARTHQMPNDFHRPGLFELQRHRLHVVGHVHRKAGPRLVLPCQRLHMNTRQTGHSRSSTSRLGINNRQNTTIGRPHSAHGVRPPMVAHLVQPSHFVLLAVHEDDGGRLQRLHKPCRLREVGMCWAIGSVATESMSPKRDINVKGQTGASVAMHTHMHRLQAATSSGKIHAHTEHATSGITVHNHVDEQHTHVRTHTCKRHGVDGGVQGQLLSAAGLHFLWVGQQIPRQCALNRVA